MYREINRLVHLVHVLTDVLIGALKERTLSDRTERKVDGTGCRTRHAYLIPEVRSKEVAVEALA